VLRAERSSYHYVGKSTDQADLKQRIKEIAETRVRYGYRRIHVLLQREGWAINGKRVYRLHCYPTLDHAGHALRIGHAVPAASKSRRRALDRAKAEALTASIGCIN